MDVTNNSLSLKNEGKKLVQKPKTANWILRAEIKAGIDDYREGEI